MNKIWPDIYDKRYIHWLQLEATVEAHSFLEYRATELLFNDLESRSYQYEKNQMLCNVKEHPY